jgi:hypothetical protein
MIRPTVHACEARQLIKGKCRGSEKATDGTGRTSLPRTRLMDRQHGSAVCLSHDRIVTAAQLLQEARRWPVDWRAGEPGKGAALSGPGQQYIRREHSAAVARR